MKYFIKHLLLFTLILSTSLFSLVACDKPDNNRDNQISTKQVIAESVTKMEDMFTSDITTLTSVPFALVLPNQDVNYENERNSVISGSCFSMYTAKYISSLADFETNVTYKDTIEESDISLEFLFRAEETENGITANMEMHQSIGQDTNVNKIQIYFQYDYQNKTALDTTIVSFGTNGIALAKLDYQTNEAFAYEFKVESADYDTVKNALSQKNFDFDKFIECDILSYKLAIMQIKLETMQAYIYDAGQVSQDSSITQQELETFYNNIYSKIKNECIERAFLNKETATNKVYYKDMYTYAIEQVTQLVNPVQ